MRAAILDSRVFTELMENSQGFLRALGAVSASGVAFGIGAGLLATKQPGSPTFIEAFLLAAAIIPISWVFWAAVNYVIGGLVLRGKASYSQILRALGICYAPGVLMGLSAMPGFGLILVIFSAQWVMVSGIVAIKSTNRVGVLRVIVPVVLGWIPMLVLTALLLLQIERA